MKRRKIPSLRPTWKRRQAPARIWFPAEGETRFKESDAVRIVHESRGRLETSWGCPRHEHLCCSIQSVRGQEYPNRTGSMKWAEIKYAPSADENRRMVVLSERGGLFLSTRRPLWKRTGIPRAPHAFRGFMILPRLRSATPALNCPGSAIRQSSSL
jgi:hypothetical protein